VEKQDQTTNVTINRPEVKNAVNGATAEALAEAFRRFDSEETSSVANLTGTEAKAMGLVNRLTAPGAAPEEALTLADQLVGYPQLCLRSDRLSAYQQWSQPLPEARQPRRNLTPIFLASTDHLLTTY
jgi:enoyl-CoA hydratase/carnithine racemase